jgi:DNA (cytosine-5)-methyltransferase 1
MPETVTDTDNAGCSEPGGAIAMESEHAAAERRSGTHWGPYGPAIARWETVIGRPAPAPVDDRGLNPSLVEWMMGLPEGWVCGLGLSRTAELRMLGNGVVPQQAALALDLLDSASVPEEDDQ